MPKIARVVIPGCPHHIVQRGNRRLKVFFSDADKELYLKLIGRHAQKFGLAIWAYCLMDNHVHMVMVPKERNSLARGLGEAHRKYTSLINIRENWRGYLWQGRFISYPMDGGHLFAAIRYVERNPVRAQIVSRAELYKWSSAPAHVLNAQDKLLSPCPLTVEVKDWASYLGQKDEAGEVRKLVAHERTGRPLGDKAFVKKLEELTGRILAPRKRGRPGDTIPFSDFPKPPKVPEER
jgi:putative transposase